MHKMGFLSFGLQITANGTQTLTQAIKERERNKRARGLIGLSNTKTQDNIQMLL